MDAWNGDVLYKKDAETPHAQASITKIMTGVVVLERAKLDDVVLVPKEAAETGESTSNLVEGEKLTVEELLEMALMRSGNDAAVALAIHVGGSVEGFAGMMNQKAVELGLRRSHFTNPHGLDAEGHYQSALDIANLTRYALQNPKFAQIVATPEKTIPRANYPNGYTIKNTNNLLRMRSDCIGVKTGWTGDAGWSLCAACQQGGRRFIAVVLASEDRFWEAHSLFNWAFDTYVERVVVASGLSVADAPLTGGEVAFVAAVPAETLVATMHVTQPRPEVTFTQTVFTAPVAAGDVIGAIAFRYGDQTYETPAVASRTVRRSFPRTVVGWPSSGFLAGCTLTGLLCSLSLTGGRRRRRGR